MRRTRSELDFSLRTFQWRYVFTANESWPMGTSTTFTPPLSAMRMPVPLKKAVSSGVGNYPFGGKAIVLLGLMAIPVLHNSC